MGELNTQFRRVIGGYDAALRAIFAKFGVDTSGTKADKLDTLANGLTVPVANGGTGKNEMVNYLVHYGQFSQVSRPTEDGGILAQNKTGAPFFSTPSGLKLAQFEYGSYVGTGTFRGSENAISLTFSFAPKLVILYGYGGTFLHMGDSIGNKSRWIMDMDILTTEYREGNGFGSDYNDMYCWAKKSSDGKTVSWYTTYGSAAYQANTSGTTYRYVAMR